MDIKVIGADCENCTKLYDNTLAALHQLGIDTPVERVGDLVEIVKLGVLSAPSLMVNGQLLIAGRAASQKEIVKILKKHLGV